MMLRVNPGLVAEKRYLNPRGKPEYSCFDILVQEIIPNAFLFFRETVQGLSKVTARINFTNFHISSSSESTEAVWKCKSIA